MYHNLYHNAGAPSSKPDDKDKVSQASTSVPFTSHATSDRCHIFELPNELILHSLSLLCTNDLLPVAPVSHRLHALVIRLLHARLNEASRASDALILECYPPSQKLTAPALDCVYLSTPGLETCLDDAAPVGQLESLRDLYSRFRPQRRDYRRFSRSFPGDIPGSRTHPTNINNITAQARWQQEREQERVRQMLSLEGHELFVQLEGNLHLVRQMGFIQNLVAVHEGYVRIWRDWLAARAEADALIERRRDTLVDLDVAGPSTGAACASETSGECTFSEHESILWLDGTKNVGLRVNVKEKKWRRNMPVLMYADEEVSVSYEVTYEGE